MQGMCDCNTVWVRGAVSRIDDTTPGRKPHNINDDRVSSQVITLFYCKYQTQERGQAILLSTTPSLHCAARLSKRSMHMAWRIFQTAAFIIWFWPPKATSFPETLVSFTLKRKKKRKVMWITGVQITAVTRLFFSGWVTSSISVLSSILQ